MMRHIVAAATILGALALSGCQTTSPGPGRGEVDSTNLAQTYTQLGVEYMRQGQNETALNRLERALAADSRYAPAHDAMALLRARLGQNDKAEMHFKRSLEIDPQSSGALNNYGQFLCRTGRPDQAYGLFEKAVANPLYGTPEVAYANAGLCALAANDVERAESQFRAALQADPRLPVALLQMARISYDQQNYMSARGYLQRYTQAADHSAQSLWLGVRVERELGDNDAVSSYALTLKNNFPDSEETRLLLQSEKN